MGINVNEGGYRVGERIVWEWEVWRRRVWVWVWGCVGVWRFRGGCLPGVWLVFTTVWLTTLHLFPLLRDVPTPASLSSCTCSSPTLVPPTAGPVPFLMSTLILLLILLLLRRALLLFRSIRIFIRAKFCFIYRARFALERKVEVYNTASVLHGGE